MVYHSYVTYVAAFRLWLLSNQQIKRLKSVTISEAGFANQFFAQGEIHHMKDTVQQLVQWCSLYKVVFLIAENCVYKY